MKIEFGVFFLLSLVAIFWLAAIGVNLHHIKTALRDGVQVNITQKAQPTEAL